MTFLECLTCFCYCDDLISCGLERLATIKYTYMAFFCCCCCSSFAVAAAYICLECNFKIPPSFTLFLFAMLFCFIIRLFIWSISNNMLTENQIEHKTNKTYNFFVFFFIVFLLFVLLPCIHTGNISFLKCTQLMIGVLIRIINFKSLSMYFIQPCLNQVLLLLITARSSLEKKRESKGGPNE